MAITRSIELFEQAKQVLVGGVNSPVRSFQSVGGNPLIVKSGKAAQIIDSDNNIYTDYCLGWGALIYGHAHRNVVLAAKRTAEYGISFGITSKPEIDLAKFIVEHISSIERIRFVNSGTEAAMSAIRLARGYTQRNLVIKFDGCYHGHVDDLLIKAGSGVANLHESSSQGIPPAHIESTISLPYNDGELFAETVDRYKDQIACVIVEPVAGNMGVIPAEINFLKTLRALTKKFKIVLIFDEIITGFRTNLGGAQHDFGIMPDITCLGKIIGGGFPIGAYGGRSDIMECLAPLGGVYQAGTFSGNPVVMRAGLATLKLLSKEFYKSLNARAEAFAQQLNGIFAAQHIPASISHYKSMLSLRFSNRPVGNYTDAQSASNQEIYAQLFQHLLRTGIYWPPADLESFFISGMHSKKDLQKLTDTLQNFFTDRINKEVDDA